MMDFMDFRWNQRKSMKVDVTLACGDKPEVSGVAQNISNGGLYVTTNVANVDLYAHCMVNVKFDDNDESSDSKLSKNDIQAMVAYKDDNGIGLMFYDNDSKKDQTK